MQIELSRLARAVHADVERIGQHRYEVRRAGHLHLVDLSAPAGEECDCPDYRVRGSLCVHLLACYLAEGERDVVRSLRALVSYPGAVRLIRSQAA